MPIFPDPATEVAVPAGVVAVVVPVPELCRVAITVAVTVTAVYMS